MMNLIGESIPTATAGYLTITSLAPGGDEGAQGRVYSTSNADLYVKVWDPSNIAEIRDKETARQDVVNRYTSLARLRFFADEPLS